MKLSIFLSGAALVKADDFKSRHCAYNVERDKIPGGNFPEHFKWSCATAAYQIEGGWNQDGKGRNIWDDFSQKRTEEWPAGQGQPNRPIDPECTDGNNCVCRVDNCDNGDIACDSYNNVERDIKEIVNFSCYSWSLFNKEDNLVKLRRSRTLTVRCKASGIVTPVTFSPFESYWSI